MKLQEKMFAIVQAWQESEMTKVEYLSDKAIGLPKFDYWLYKYRNLPNGTHPQLPAQAAPEAFKSFILSDEPDDANRQSVSMEIVTPSGVRITIFH